MTTHWILVADAARARLFSAGPALDRFALLEEHAHDESRAKNSDLVSSPPGRMNGAPGGPQSALDRHTEPHHVEVDAFARQLAERVRLGRADASFEGLILVAPPAFLGLLRGHLDAPTARAVLGSVDRDWTREEARDLPDKIRAGLPEGTVETPKAK